MTTGSDCMIRVRRLPAAHGRLYARDHPRPVQHGGRVGLPRLFAPADDRNALATPTAGGAIQSQPTRRRRARSVWSAQRRCNGAPLSETKVKADLAYLPLGARKSIPEQSETYICHHLPRIKRC
jgi:hypothetical protein